MYGSHFIDMKTVSQRGLANTLLNTKLKVYRTMI